MVKLEFLKFVSSRLSNHACMNCTAELPFWLYTNVRQVCKCIFFCISSGFFPEYKSSEKSFLFSLRNKDNLEPFNCPTYADHRNKKAICCECSSGAIFGEGYDLSISSNASTNNNSYSNLGITYRPPDGYGPGTPQTKALLAGSYYFTPNEIEVFCR